MARLTRPDGAEIAWRLAGDDGPLVVLARMALQDEALCAGIVEELAGDHRVLVYDLRGCGGSSRAGPYDVETDAGDLAGLVGEAGGGALALALGDGARRSVRAAAEHPDLIHTVVVSGELPLGRLSGEESHEALSRSPAVLQTLIGMLETDFRAGLRGMLASSGSAWTDDAMRARLDATEAYVAQDVAVARLRSWIRDDSNEPARELGDRLLFLHYPGNAWFQGSLEPLRKDLPEARFEEVSEGVLSSPAENAVAIRRLLGG